MTDWKMIASARGLALTEEELGRIGGALDALEKSWRPLAEKIPHDAEPAIVMQSISATADRS
jgi:hypothetical protein